LHACWNIPVDCLLSMGMFPNKPDLDQRQDEDPEVQERTVPPALRDHPAMKALREKLLLDREKLQDDQKIV
jgi:hypothetical protein